MKSWVWSINFVSCRSELLSKSAFIFMFENNRSIFCLYRSAQLGFCLHLDTWQHWAVYKITTLLFLQYVQYETIYLCHLLFYLYTVYKNALYVYWRECTFIYWQVIEKTATSTLVFQRLTGTMMKLQKVSHSQLLPQSEMGAEKPNQQHE